ncbi:hypothetical protein VF21_00316 [Pseudogymnoascus sp. 05NY08]|nr:hypothetical protein VF21_00316 [Pseudogymnoascus sp. 05NY08]
MPAWSSLMGELSIESQLAELQIAEPPFEESSSEESSSEEPPSEDPPFEEPPSEEPHFEEPPSEEPPSKESSSTKSAFVDHTTSSLLKPAVSSSQNCTTSASSFSLLPLLDAASLSLTCKSALFLLRSKHLNQFRWRGNPERLEFLHLLARDLPSHIVCIECSKLHSRPQKQLHKATPCKKADFNSLVYLHIHPDFDTITFLLAMKRYHNSLDPSAQLFLLSGSRTISKADHTHHWESSTRIINGNLLLRQPTSTPAPAQTSTMCSTPTHVTRDPSIPAGIPAGIPLKLSCRASHWDDADRNASCAKCAGLFQCMFCPTEFEIEARMFANQGVALILTRWLDLGDGGLGDERYASRLWGYKGRLVRFEAGSIKAAFEGGGVGYGEAGGYEV